MPCIDGATLREWRRSRGWDVPEMERRLRRAARETGVSIADDQGLKRMIYAWERDSHKLTERYQLLYSEALGVDPHRWLMHPEGRPVEILDRGEPVRELFVG